MTYDRLVVTPGVLCFSDSLCRKREIFSEEVCECMSSSKKKWAEGPGCMSRAQVSAIENALTRACEDPSLLCDLEGCGPIAELERSFARICETRFALAVSSSTAAIHTALLASGIGPGDEVIVTPYSWAQSVAPVLFTGATAVFADIDPRTLNMNPESVLSRISPRTRAILPVHLFGHPADMVRFEQMAREAGSVLVSDAAHAPGATLHGRPIGVWGDITCFSLSRGKLVSGGEGGILATNDETIFERAVSLTQHPERLRRIEGPGKTTEGFGLNFRLHPLAALVALCDLKVMEEKLKHRKAVLASFWKGLGTQDVFSSPTLFSAEEPAPYGIPLTFHKENGRDRMALCLQDRGVPLRCGPVRTPLHLRLRKGPGPRSAFHNSQRRGACPVAEERCKSRELWALSALDMDGISAEEAHTMGEMIREEAERFGMFLQADTMYSFKLK